MVQIIQKFFNKLLSLFNLQIIKKNENGVIDKRSVASFQISDKHYKLYFEGLNKSKNNHSDNFWKQSRFLDLMNLVQMVLKKENTKDFAEVGCWKGHSSFFISKLIAECNKKISFHIFDSFEGLSQASIKDININKFEKKKSRRSGLNLFQMNNFLKVKFSKSLTLLKFIKVGFQKNLTW